MASNSKKLSYFRAFILALLGLESDTFVLVLLLSQYEVARAYFISQIKVESIIAEGVCILNHRDGKDTKIDNNNEETGKPHSYEIARKVDMEDYEKPDNEVPNLSTVRLSFEEISPSKVMPELDEVEPVLAKESTTEQNLSFQKTIPLRTPLVQELEGKDEDEKLTEKEKEKNPFTLEEGRKPYSASKAYMPTNTSKSYMRSSTNRITGR